MIELCVDKDLSYSVPCSVRFKLSTLNQAWPLEITFLIDDIWVSPRDENLNYLK